MRICLVIVSIMLSPALFAQGGLTDSGWTVPRTEFGHPDLQGNWGNINQTPFERPEALANKQSYTEEEARRIRNERIDGYDSLQAPLDPNRAPPPAGALIAQEADINFNPERMLQVNWINGEYRTSLIIDPPNGRLPYRENRAEDIYEQWRSQGYGAFDGPEIRPANERCLGYPRQLPIIMPLGSSHTRYLQIVQTENYVVIYGEYSAGLRIIRLGGEHPMQGWPRWRGDSIGFWEGDSLVIHTKNFKPEQSNRFIRSSTALETTETLTAVAADELVYSYTFSDSNFYTQPFTAEMQLNRLAEGEYLYESACHEGNYSLPGILAGARRQEMDQR